MHYAAHAQDKRDDPIEFTPHVTAIVLTVTPEPVLKVTVGLGQYFDIANSVRAYERRTKEDRLAIDGIFREVDAASSP